MSSKLKTTSPLRWLNSMTVRLTVLVVLASALILVFMTSTMKQYLSRAIRQEEIRFLSDTAYVLQDIFQRQGNQSKYSISPALIQQLNQEIKTVHFSKLELLIETQGHKILLKTPEFDRVSSQFFHQLLAKHNLEEQTEPLAFSRNGLDYLMIAWTLKCQNDFEPTRFFLVLDITGNNQLIHSFEDKVTVILLFGLLSILCLGFLVTYLGLSPLREISREVSVISPSDLNKRIDRLSWPRELRRLASSFDDMLVRSQRAFQQISQFSADVAHEFRTPITNLKGETEVALSQARTPEEYQELLHSHLEEYDRVTRMIDKLLFLARTEANETRLHKTQFHLEPEIKAVIEYFEPLIQEKHIQLQIVGNGLITADQPMIRRAISNLLSNALKYTEQNGKIDVEVKPLADLSVKVTIKDNGCGIPPEHLEHIFDRFYRVDSVRQHHEGTGLGLSIVQSIMILHDSTVQVESEPNRGTLVKLIFHAVKA